MGPGRSSANAEFERFHGFEGCHLSNPCRSKVWICTLKDFAEGKIFFCCLGYASRFEA